MTSPNFRQEYEEEDKEIIKIIPLNLKENKPSKVFKNRIIDFKDEFNFEHKVDYLDNEFSFENDDISDDKEKIISEKLATKYNFFTNPPVPILTIKKTIPQKIIEKKILKSNEIKNKMFSFYKKDRYRLPFLINMQNYKAKQETPSLKVND